MNFHIRRLAPADIDLILRLQRQVRDALPDPTVFQASTPEFVAYCLADGGLCYAVSHGDQTVAYRMVYFPGDGEFNLAKDSSLPPAEYHSVAHWDTIAVLPAWRGHGLARLMNTRALADVALTSFRHLFATSAPAKPYGVRALLEAGFRPISVVRKFSGKLRFLCYRPNPQQWPCPPADVHRWLPMSATADLTATLADGWVGTAVALDRGSDPLLGLRRQPPPFHREFLVTTTTTREDQLDEGIGHNGQS